MLLSLRRDMAAAFSNVGWPALPALVSLLLLLAVRILPADTRPVPAVPRDERRDYTAFAVGLLLLVEPLMHLGLLAWGGWFPSASSRDAVLPMPVFGAASPAPWWAGALNILTLSVLVPVAEEFFFRGRLLGWLSKTWGVLPAVSFTTLAFAAAHGSAVQALVAVPLGLLLAFIRFKTGDLGGCILAHACHNSLFLFVGPMLIGMPWAAPLLALGGVILLAAAWMHHAAPAARYRHLRAVGAVVAAAAVIMATFPFYRRVQDMLWVTAAHRVVTQWIVGNDVLLRRLDHQERRGRLTPMRRDALYDRLCNEPCQQLRGGNPRQSLVLAQLDPMRFANGAVGHAYDALLDLGDPHLTWDRVATSARRLGYLRPDDFAAVVTVSPELLVQWLPLPHHAADGVAQLIATTGPRRRMLLAAWERAFPGRVAELIFSLPATQMTPLDRRHLFAHYPDARELLEALSRSDPERARALGMPLGMP